MDRIGWLLAVPAMVLGAVAVGGAADGGWQQPGWFALVTGGAALVAMVVATAVVAIADRTDTAEQGLLGSVVLSASVMAGVHAVLTPGVIIDSTAASPAPSLLTTPFAAAFAAPLLLRSTGCGRWAARHWRAWTLVGLSVAFAVGSVAVAAPEALVVDLDRSPALLAVAATSASAFVLLAVSRRRLATRIGSAHGVISLSLASLAGGALAPLADAGSVGSWIAHLATAGGLVGAATGMAAVSRADRAVRSMFAPVIARDPLLALDLEASPTARRSVDELDGGPIGCRSQTVKSAELALRVGERCGMSASELRALGLAALLHETGKPEAARRVLSLQRRLTADELELIRTHPIDGEALLSTERLLAPAAPLVRSHHERIDGGGHPDGLSGDAIPLGSRIIAVCDALTALSRDRPYRRALPLPIAVAVLREHAGSQWDERVVEHTIALLPSFWTGQVTGTSPTAASANGIPDDIADLLVSVDIEI